jgi:hypothetical protein
MPPRRPRWEMLVDFADNRCAGATEPVPPSGSLSHCMSSGSVCATIRRLVGTLCHVVGDIDTRHVQEYPQRLAFSGQIPRKRSGCIFTCGVLTEQRTETRIPGSPLAHRGPLRAHMTPPLQLAVQAVSKAIPASRCAANPFVVQMRWARQLCRSLCQC